MSDIKKKVTLKDIAEKTGLSVNTVSRVLNKKPYYTKEVEEKVNAACKELGYIVDMNASGLRSGSTRTVAILYDDLVNPFYSYTTDIISKRFEEHGYNCIMFSNNDRSPYVDYDLMRSVMARKPDGILSFLEPAEDMVDFIKNSGIPFVIFGRDGSPYGMIGVDADEVYGGRIAGEHLLARGYRKLAYIGSWHNVKVCLDRQKGLEEALAGGGMTLSPEHVFYIREQDFGGIVDKIVEDKVDGILCFNDVIAFIVMEALEERGLEAAADYGVVGFDNIQHMMRMPRLLTTVDVGSRDFAEAGAAVMLSLLSGGEEEIPSFRATHKSFLVKGKSTR